jgi:hypothetical protein
MNSQRAQVVWRSVFLSRQLYCCPFRRRTPCSRVAL